MAPDPLLATETKITLLFMFLGLTTWYLVGEAGASRTVEFGALIGIGVVVPTLVNEWRRRAD
jgi:hypothetical protein